MNGTESVATRRLSEDHAARRNVEESDLFKRLQEKLRTVEIDGQKFYIAEGDTLLDKDQLGVYALNKQKAAEAFDALAEADASGLGTRRLTSPPKGLIGITQNGKLVRWKPGTILSYRVVKNTFMEETNYQLLVDQMKLATVEWENACGVKFEHKGDLDDLAGVEPAGALFTVRELDTGGEFIAAAFFPNDPKDRRRVLIDPSYYTTNFDQVGVLRHELGHVLGFRHEHIHHKAPAGCPNEDNWDIKILTDYDSNSVMHYLCGGVGSPALKITDLDRTGAQAVYGPPLNSVQFVG